VLQKNNRVGFDLQRRIHEKQRGMMNTGGATNKVRAWQPSLQSISESTS